MPADMDIWSLFSQTVASMNDTANSQYYNTLNDINNIQAHSIDPSDMGAYNLTLYGMNTVRDIQSTIVGNVSNLKSLTEQAMPGHVAAGSGSASIVALPNISPLGSMAATMGNISSAQGPLTAILLVLAGIAVGAMIFHRK